VLSAVLESSLQCFTLKSLDTPEPLTWFYWPRYSTRGILLSYDALPYRYRSTAGLRRVRLAKSAPLPASARDQYGGTAMSLFRPPLAAV